MRERWAFLNTVTRRSAVAVLVSGALAPLRTLATKTKADVAKVLDGYDARKADYAHYLKKKGEDDPTKVAAAKDGYVGARAAAVDALAEAKTERDKAVADAACCLAAVHAELFGATADYVRLAARKEI